jgi:hypothetical protein
LKGSADALHQGVPRSRSTGAQPRLGLRPSVFYWVEVRRIWGQKFEPCSARADVHADFGVLMNSEIVPDHDVARLQQRGEMVSRPHSHGVGVHRPGQQQRRVDAFDVERGDQRECFPTAPRYVVDDSFAAGSPRFLASQREIDPTLVDKPESRPTPATSPMLKPLPSRDYVWTRAFACTETLFFRVRPRRRRLRHIVVSLTLSRAERSSSFASSTSVASGCLSTRSRSLRSFAPETRRSLPGAFPARALPVRRT